MSLHDDLGALFARETQAQSTGMPTRFSSRIAKLRAATVAVSAIAFASSAFAGPMPALDEAPQVVRLQPVLAPQRPTDTKALAKEQAMSTAALIDRWNPHIKEASRRFKISADWIKAVMRVESGGRTLSDDNQPIASTAGAMGIMQVMPETYRDMRLQFGLGADPHDPRDNILAGTAYLSWLKEKYGFPKMFAAYNAGPATFEAQSAGKRKLPKETRDYVKRISVILGIEEPAGPLQPAQPTSVVAMLTRPGGSKITIDGSTVDKIRAVFPNEFVPGVRTVVIMGERMQGVLEDVAAVTAALKPRVSARYLPSS
jgi:soluble lytic murein transglycosylase-like protein